MSLGLSIPATIKMDIAGNSKMLTFSTTLSYYFQKENQYRKVW